MSGDQWTMYMCNQKSVPLYPNLFRGFVSNSSKAKAVAWRISDYPLSGENNWGFTKWNFQYGVVWGQVDDGETAFTTHDSTTCNLGDLATLSFEGGMIKCHITTGAGVEGAIKIIVPAGFPSGNYVGFGAMGKVGQLRPTGVVEASAGLNPTFTPKQEYSINFNTENTDFGLYMLQESTSFQKINFTGKSEKIAQATLQEDGNWIIKYTNTAP